MAGRLQFHQLPSGLYVSGKLEQPKERPPTMAARSMPYTGGDIKNSGELGRMFDISVADPTSFQGPQSIFVGGAARQPPPRIASATSLIPSTIRSGTKSDPVRKTSGHLSQLQPTGLITCGPLNPSGQIKTGPKRSEPMDHHQHHQSSIPKSSKPKYGSAVTILNTDPVRVRFKLPKVVIWALMVVAAMALLIGAFLSVAVKKPLLIIAIAAAIFPATVVFTWNYIWRRKGLLNFVNNYPNTILRGAIDGQFVKVTGVVTCGSIPLESSYKTIQRCVYVSTELYEYKEFRCFSWRSRHSERYVSDFYISDFQSGLRALVKAGYGSEVSPFVKMETVANVTSQTKDLSPSFLQWLTDRNLCNNSSVMRLKEGYGNIYTKMIIFIVVGELLLLKYVVRYIKEGSTVSVMGMIRKNDNVLMIIPPVESVTTGCQWWRCLLPSYTDGIIITCDDNQNADVIPV